MATVRVCGDYFDLIEQEKFTKKPNISWQILYAGTDAEALTSYIVVIPFAYDGAETILKNAYPYPLVKSVSDKQYFVVVKGFTLEQIRNVLLQF